MNENCLHEEIIADPDEIARLRNRVQMRKYQVDALRTIYAGALRQQGESFTVIFPRQSGKNETQAQLESALLLCGQDRGGSIVKVIPTTKTQGQISKDRLENMIKTEGLAEKKPSRDRTVCGSTQLRYLSAQPGATIVGATANLLLEVDEAQEVSKDKFDRDAAPMAASTNAARVFWGTAWDEHTLLARESRLARQAFLVTAARVGQEVPEYTAFVRFQIAALGREHPTVRTQYFCEEIGDLTGMFSPERQRRMRGSHQPLSAPEADRCYVFLIDIAGSDEMSTEERRANGFSDRRDATVLTICEVSLPEDPEARARGAVWKTVGRRYYRNLPAELLEKEISGEFDFWQPRRAVLDHTGLGCLLSDYLNRRYPGVCRACDITAAGKSRMAWEFLALISTGRWQEYAADELSLPAESPFQPGQDRYEILSDPALLQQMFFRELRACRMDPAANGQQVRWGVPSGTRDPQSGRMIHDDLVLSAALCVFCDTDLPILTELPEAPACSFDTLSLPRGVLP